MDYFHAETNVVFQPPYYCLLYETVRFQSRIFASSKASFIYLYLNVLYLFCVRFGTEKKNYTLPNIKKDGNTIIASPSLAEVN